MLSCVDQVPDDLLTDIRPQCGLRHHIHPTTEPLLQELRQPDEVEEIRSGAELHEQVDITSPGSFRA